MADKINILPKHLGLIVDGNGRWAKAKGFPRTIGHSHGIKNLEKILKECFYTYNINIVSVYLFSTDNWNRPKSEVDFLMNLFRKYLGKNLEKTYPEVKVNIIGDINKFEPDLIEKINNLVEKTKDNTKYILNLALNYGGQEEIVYAVNKLLNNGIKAVNQQMIAENLYTANQPELDYVIRTSGEQRLSNFMLWQMKYAELYFTSTFWPDFDKKELNIALNEFQNRNRRFGKLK